MKILLTFIAASVFAVGSLVPARAAADTAANASKASPKSAAKKDSKTMSLSKKCPPGNLHRSRCMIELLLEDLAANYGGVGGGGISSIRAATSTSYVVSLPQEERIDVLTYEFDVKADGTISVKSKVASTQEVGPRSSTGEGGKK